MEYKIRLEKMWRMMVFFTSSKKTRIEIKYVAIFACLLGLKGL